MCLTANLVRRNHGRRQAQYQFPNAMHVAPQEKIFMVEDDKNCLNVATSHCWGCTKRYLESLAHLVFPADSLLLLLWRYPTVSGGRGVLPFPADSLP